MSKTLDNTGGTPLFNQPPPPPPTGPKAEEYTPEEGRPPAFAKFLASDEGQEFWRQMQQ